MSESSGCQIRLEEDQLVVANLLFERRWRVRNGLLHVVSYKDLRSGRDWISRESATPSPFPPLTDIPGEERKLSLVCRVGRPSPVSAGALEAILSAVGDRLTLEYKFVLFPEASGVAMQLAVSGPGASALSAPDAGPVSDIPTGDEKTLIRQDSDLPPLDGLEHLNLAPPHLRVTQVSFADVTDNHNELAQERNWLLHPSEGSIAVPGNLFFVEDVLNGEGLILLKEAPLPDSRPVKNWADLRVHGKACFSSAIKAAEYGPGHARWPLAYQVGLFGHGMDPALTEGYRWVVLAYQGGRAGRIRALQSYQRQWRRYEPGRDGLLIGNTWGDRSMNSRVGETFIQEEISAAGRMGLDVMQVDDGWQRGLDNAPPSGSTDLWKGIWNVSTHFWQPHPARFPKGFAPVLASCGRHGVRMGLWYVVDSHDDYVNWERDVDVLMGLHRDHGVSYFKFDGVALFSRVGEQRFQRLLVELQVRSEGRIVVDLDVTAGVRPGYFRIMDQGPLFVENRYTDWHNYWPHHSLRNLWTLAQYVDPVRLRFEFLNNSRNIQFYAGDPLAPAHYSGDYLFATVMVSSPLAWFEVQHFPAVAFRKVARLVRIWKQHRDDLFRGTIIPIGEQPDGASWTGFCSASPDGHSALVLVFREFTGRPGFAFELPLEAGRVWKVTKLAGTGRARCRDGALQANLPRSLSYLFLKLEIDVTRN